MKRLILTLLVVIGVVGCGDGSGSSQPVPCYSAVEEKPAEGGGSEIVYLNSDGYPFARCRAGVCWFEGGGEEIDPASLAACEPLPARQRQ